MGDPASAHTHFAQGMALYDAPQHRSSEFLYGEDAGVQCHTYAAWALWSLGHPNQGLTQSHEALALVQQSAHLFSLSFVLSWAAVFHQFRREVRLTQERAEAAISIAQSQHAKSWELRAATSLARLWQQQGKRQEAYDLLALVYNWFTEGFDTADLQEAKTLLDALA